MLYLLCDPPLLVSHFLGPGLSCLAVAQSGRTGLIQAANTGQIDVLQLLLDRRSNVNTAGTVCQSPCPRSLAKSARPP